MDIKDYIHIEIDFYKVPKECLIKTYLGSKVVIVSYGKHASTTWDKYNTIKGTPNIYLDATTNEIKIASDRFRSFIDKHKPKEKIPKWVTLLSNSWSNISETVL